MTDNWDDDNVMVGPTVIKINSSKDIFITSWFTWTDIITWNWYANYYKRVTYAHYDVYLPLILTGGPYPIILTGIIVTV